MVLKLYLSFSSSWHYVYNHMKNGSSRNTTLHSTHLFGMYGEILTLLTSCICRGKIWISV